MESQAWLDYSLQRSSRLGLEVLERASRHRVDWTSTSASQSTTTSDAAHAHAAHVVAKRTHSELQDAFATIAEFMAHTCHHCKKFYDSGSCTELSDPEKTHMSRFHAHRGADWMTFALSRRHGPVSATGEDFYIEVSPGEYAITASLPDSQQQTQMISIKPGEIIDLTFNL